MKFQLPWICLLPEIKKKAFTLEWFQTGGEFWYNKGVSIACEQVLQGILTAGGKRKESLQLGLWNLNICIEKFNVIGRDDIGSDVIYLWLVFFNVCLHSRSFPLRADWWKSDCSVDGEPQGNWRWNSNSRDVIASTPSLSHPTTKSALESSLLWSDAWWHGCKVAKQRSTGHAIRES